MASKRQANSGTPAAVAGARLETVAVEKINAAPYNPRKDLQPGDVEYERLKRSLREFGCVEPLVWNRRTGHLVGGHQRFKVLLEGQPTALEVSVVDLPLAKEKALNVALNKIGGDWDDPKLLALLADLQADAEVDATLTGFDELELAARLGQEEADTAPKLGALEYRVVVTCRSEQQQRDLLVRLEGEGYAVAALTR